MELYLQSPRFRDGVTNHNIFPFAQEVQWAQQSAGYAVKTQLSVSVTPQIEPHFQGSPFHSHAGRLVCFQGFVPLLNTLY